MSISRQDVERMARLARLELSESEVVQMQQQLDSIVTHVQTISAVNTDDVAPDVAGSQSVLTARADEVRPGLSTADALAEAPERSEDSFCVPAFVDEA